MLPLWMRLLTYRWFRLVDWIYGPRVCQDVNMIRGLAGNGSGVPSSIPMERFPPSDPKSAYASTLFFLRFSSFSVSTGVSGISIAASQTIRTGSTGSAATDFVERAFTRVNARLLIHNIFNY